MAMVTAVGQSKTTTKKKRIFEVVTSSIVLVLWVMSNEMLKIKEVKIS